jgi:acetylornithine/N-succinyldiaminopimelate aminotransferase
MDTRTIIATEDAHMPPFFTKTPVAFERGAGVRVWDTNGREYLDFTAGWGVTCLGHSHPAIISAINEQTGKIMQGPNGGLTYTPARAKLLSRLTTVLPDGLTRVFFCNSGAEANDAAIKLARKVTGRLDIIAAQQSFHGRTISTASATGQAKHRERFNPLMPNHRFVKFGDLDAIRSEIDERVAAVILEPVQGEGGVNIPPRDYLASVSELCHAKGALLIIDEIQTGFGRTGQLFAIGDSGVKADFLTLAKGIAGGFPFGAFAITEAVAAKLEKGDHGGTYSGNPLGCAVADAVIGQLQSPGLLANVRARGAQALERMRSWQQAFAGAVTNARGVGLLLAAQLRDERLGADLYRTCIDRGIIVNVTQGRILRLFPALIITEAEMSEGLDLVESGLQSLS